MRVTQSMYYKNISAEGNVINKQLFDVNKQIASGQKIKYAYENTTTFVDTLRLDDEITTLNQVKSSTSNGYKFSTQTDTTFNDISKTLDTVKVKLLNASNGTHSDTSISAIAEELKGIKKHLFALSNTQINGKYLFSGTATNIKPISEDGVYHGNDGDLKSFFGNGIQQKYNISGKDVFLGSENLKRNITTNVPMFNQSKLHPDIMVDETIDPVNSVEEYLKNTDTIRDMLGDNNTKIDTVNEKNIFYIRGVKHDGIAFKETISMKDTDSVESLLVKIGEAYGNAGNTSVVNVSLSKNGQIEIEDKLSGSSKIDFNMIASTAQSYSPPLLATSVAPNSNQITVPSVGTLNVDDTLLIDGSQYSVTAVSGGAAPETITLNNTVPGSISNIEVFKSTGTDLENDIASNYSFNKFGVNVVEFNKSEFVEYQSSITTERSIFDKTDYVLDADLFTTEGKPSDGSTLATHVLKPEVRSIALSGTRTDGSAMPVGSTLDITNTTTLNDIVTFIDNSYDLTNEINVSIQNSKIVINSANESVPINIVLESFDAVSGGGNRVDGLPSNAGKSYDEGNFIVKDNKVLSNQSQIVSSTNDFATNSTKLVDVSGASNLDAETLEFNGNDINGNPFSVNINLANAGSSFDYTDSAGVTTNFPIFDAVFQDNDNDGIFTPGVDAGVQTPANEVSYKQLFDVMNMVSTAQLPQNTNGVAGIQYDEYYDAVKVSNLSGTTEFTQDSKIEFSDKTTTNTKAQFKLSDAKASDFTQGASILSFHNNSALTIKDSKMDFFNTIDEVINSVEIARLRPDGDDKDPRTLGMQNAITLLDSLMEHVQRNQTQAGVQSQTLDAESQRSDLLILSTKTLRSSVIDVDIAEAAMNLQQLTLNYQAMLSSVGKVSQLSLVNYL